MKENRTNFAIEKMCKVFKVSRSGYYDTINRSPSLNALSTLKIKKMIKSIYDESKGRYGSPKITKQLRSMGLKVSRPRVARIMQSEGIKRIIQKKYRVITTNSNHNYPVAKTILIEISK